MKGTEKQIKWAIEIQSRVITIMTGLINLASQQSAPEAAIADMTNILNAAKNCDNASAMINCYKDVKTAQNIITVRRIHACNTPAEHALLCK